LELVGKEVTTLLRNEQKTPGMHARTFEAQYIPNGVYLLQAGEFREKSFGLV